MKLKTYLTTLILFLFFFNGSIFIVTTISLRSDISTAQERGLSEHYFIVSNYAKDLAAMENRGASLKDSSDMLFQSYADYYGNQHVWLTLSQNGHELYSNVPEHMRTAVKNVQDTHTRIVDVHRTSGTPMLEIDGLLPEPYNEYQLTYQYDLSDITATWRKMVTFLYFFGCAMSAVMSIILYILLSRLFKPLHQITAASRRIAAGRYDERIITNYDHDLSDLANSFNHMSEEIQRQLENLKQEVQQRQRFIDNLAHEIRTPLTSIYGYAEYMQKAVLSEQDSWTATNYIMSESRRLQNVAYRLLDLASLRNTTLQFNAVALPELLDGVENTMNPIALKKQVNIVRSCSAKSIKGDRELLETLLINLLDNAIKACATGGTVELRAYEEKENVILSVQDNGKGMTSEQLDHITEAFYRVDSSRNREEGGAGLGLALCEQIASLHQAKLRFISKPGKGTTAEVIFTS